MEKFIRSKSALIALILAPLIWGATGPIMKQTLHEVPLFNLGFIRFFIAAVLLYPFIRKKITFDLIDLPLILLHGLIGTTFLISFFFWGISITTALNASIITALIPLFTVLCAAIFFHESIKKNIIGGTILGTFGVIIIISIDIVSKGVTISPLGDILIFLTVLCFVGNELVSKKLSQKYNAISLTFFGFVIGAMTFLPAALFELKTHPTWIFSLSSQGILGIIFGILGSSLLAHLFWYYGLSKMRASKVGFFSYLQPLAGTITAVLLLNETITPHFLLGSLFVISGLLVAETHIHYHNLQISKHNYTKNPS